MSEHKKQHYVQQSYLRRFSLNGTQISVFDKILNRAFSNSIGAVAQESHFYRLPEGLMDENGLPIELDPLFVEKWFQTIEQDFNVAIETLVDLPPDEDIGLDVRTSLAEPIAIQYLRTRAFRNTIIDGAEQFIGELMGELIRLNFDEEHLKYAPKVKYSDKVAGLMQTQIILDSERMAEMAGILQEHVWTLLINETDHPFYTSDTPVVLHNHLARPRFRPGLGLASAGIEIAFPLSSRRLLSIRDRKAFPPTVAQPENKLEPVRPENVEFYNSLQVLKCERQIYCEKADWDLAEDMICENPRLSELQSRIAVLNSRD